MSAISVRGQRTWASWSRWLFQFVLCGHPTPRCWLSQEREASSLAGHFWSQPRTPGTHYHLTLDPAVLWTVSNDTSRPTCSDSLNLMPPSPLYLRTLRRYTDAILLLLLLFPRHKEASSHSMPWWNISCIFYLLTYCMSMWLGRITRTGFTESLRSPLSLWPCGTCRNIHDTVSARSATDSFTTRMHTSSVGITPSLRVRIWSFVVSSAIWYGLV